MIDEAPIAMNGECNDWREIDRTLQGLARQRAALDANEAGWLRAAYRVQIWRHVGCVSMVDYMERYLGYGIRNAQERLKLALALDVLPAIATALASGALPFTAARALLRVVTPQTEQQWLAYCEGMSVHHIENAVAGHDQGARPTDPKQPELARRDLRYSDLRPSTVALEREALAKTRAAVGGQLSDDQFLAMVFGSFLERGVPCEPEPSHEPPTAYASDAAGREGRAKYQIATVICEQCDQGWRDSAGRRFALDASEVDRARCDAQHIGSLETDEPARATQDIPPRIRRHVLRRDRHRCTIDGCRSAANIEVHHIIAREDGGTHDAWNITLACGACHDNLHRGLITLTGKAPDQLVVTRRHAPGAHVCAPTQLDRVTIDVQAKAALVQAGFSRGQAATAVAAARDHVGADAALELLLREALRRCNKPSG